MIGDWGRLKTFVTLTQQLRILLESGQVLNESLSLIRPASSRQSFLIQYDQIVHEVSQGADFTRAWATLLPVNMRFIASVFYGYSESLVVVDQLYKLYSQRLNWATYIGRRLIYPAVLLVALVLLVIIFIVFIYPQYRTFFQSSELSYPTFFYVLDKGLYWISPLRLFLLGGMSLICVRLVYSRLQYRLFLFFFGVHHHDILALIALSLRYNRPLRDSLSEALFSPLLDSNTVYRQFMECFIESGSLSSAWVTVFPMKGFHKEWLSSIGGGSDLAERLVVFCESYKEFHNRRQYGYLSLITPICLLLISLVIVGMIVGLYIPLFMISEGI